MSTIHGGTSIYDDMLADVLITRLNKLIEDPDVRRDIQYLIDRRIEASKATVDHPTIIVVESSTDGDYYLGVLGLLNGLMGGVDVEGPRKGYGRITAEYDDDGRLMRFKRTA